MTRLFKLRPLGDCSAADIDLHAEPFTKADSNSNQPGPHLGRILC